jgi:hypothetical protein
MRSQWRAVLANSVAIARANLSIEDSVRLRSIVAIRCSGSVRPSAVLIVAANEDAEITRTSMLAALPGASAATARSIAKQTDCSPPAPAGSLSPPTTRQRAGSLDELFIAQALPLADATDRAITTVTIARTIRLVPVSF